MVLYCFTTDTLDSMAGSLLSITLGNDGFLPITNCMGEYPPVICREFLALSAQLKAVFHEQFESCFVFITLSYFQPEAAIEGFQASVDALKLLSGGWCLKIEIVIVFGNI